VEAVKVAVEAKAVGRGSEDRGGGARCAASVDVVDRVGDHGEGGAGVGSCNVGSWRRWR
jgi:hypothetical protein